MSIIKKLLGGPGFYMEAEDAPPESATPAKVQPAVVKTEPKAPVAEKVVAEAPVVEAPAPVEPKVDAATDPVPTKTSVKKKKAAAPVETAAPVAALTDVQALVENAIAQASVEKSEQEAAAERTFATDYLLVPTMKGRRKPGPSLTGFMDMASTMKR